MVSGKARILFLIIAFTCNLTALTAQVTFVSEQNGTIRIRTEGTDKRISTAISTAEKYVFYIVFYKGIPGSSLKEGLIDVTETEAEQNNKSYFDLFYKSRYRDFITTIDQNGSIIKGKNRKKSIFFDVTINVNALRKDLEDNKVIRKFGF